MKVGSPQCNAEGETDEGSGATTFRLKSKGITIFLDTWLERPSTLPKYLSIDQIDECDYIFISQCSHAHFNE
jgi:L-ascorbate metabolism protein UlaG (beta-lactamase superfamily)